ncbi:phage major capsid protein [Clostridioides difficile]|nr:hypothetical protein KW95_13965 [Clostridioides difficile]
MNKKKSLIEERNKLLGEMNLIVRDLTNISDEIEVRTLQKSFDSKKIRVEEIDRELREYEKGTTKGESRNMNLEQAKQDLANYIKGAETRNLNTTNGSAILTDVLHDEIVVKILENADLLKECKVLTTVNGSLAIPVEGELVGAKILDEGEVLTEDDTQFTTKKVETFRIESLISLTKDVLFKSNLKLEEFTIQLLARRIAKTIVQAISVGDDKGAFEGVNTINRVDAELNADNIIALVYGQKKYHQEKSILMMNRNTFVKVKQMKDTQGNYIMITNALGAGYTVLGVPVEVVAEMPDNEITIGNFEGYTVVMHQNVEITKVDKDYQSLSKGMVNMFGTSYMGGAISQTDAFATLNGATVLAKVTKRVA